MADWHQLIVMLRVIHLTIGTVAHHLDLLSTQYA